jgi:hypothetical protein
MATKINEYDGIKPPPDMKINRHSSHDAGRSDNDAGGPVSPDRYQRPIPREQGGPLNNGEK